MDFKKFQKKAATTAVYPFAADGSEGLFGEIPKDAAEGIIPVMYCALGLTGEAGEVAEQVKKSWRNSMRVTPERRKKIEDELGDVMWYVAQLATELDLDLERIADLVIAKLESRQQTGTLRNHG